MRRRFTKWLRRHPIISGTVAIVSFLLIWLPSAVLNLWSLYSNEPLFIWLSKHSLPKLVFSPLWITIPIFGGLLIVILWALFAGSKKSNEVDSTLTSIRSDDLKVELQSDDGLIAARVTNRSGFEIRVEDLWIASVDLAAKKTEAKTIQKFRFKRCIGMPHAMPPRSSFEVTFRYSDGAFQNYAQSHPDLAQTEYWVEVKLEDGTVIPSQRRQIEPPISDEDTNVQVSSNKPDQEKKTQSKDTMEKEIRDAICSKISELANIGNQMLSRAGSLSLPNDIELQFNRWSQTSEEFLNTSLGKIAVALFRSPVNNNYNPIRTTIGSVSPASEPFWYERQLYDRISSRVTRLRQIIKKIETGELETH